MAAYQFDTITASEALAIQPGDTIVGGDYSPDPRVTYLPATASDPARVQVTMGDGAFEHTVVFGANISQLSLEGRFTLPNYGTLVIGGASDETLTGGIRDTVTGQLRDFVFGGGGNDSLSANAAWGGTGNDTFQGAGPVYSPFVGRDMHGDEGDDVFIAPGGHDTIDGGAGNDVIVFEGNRGDYYLNIQGDYFTAFSFLGGTDDGYGALKFKNVETLRFADGDISTANRISISQLPSTVQEGAAGETKAHHFTVYRAGDLSDPLTIAWHATSTTGADFPTGDSAHGQVTIPAGETQAELIVYTAGDDQPEAGESFRVDLDAGEHWLFVGVPAHGYVTNDDPGEFASLTITRGSSAATQEGDNGSTPVNFTVTRSGDTSTACGATYQVYRGEMNTAEGSDFVGGTFPTGTISFAPGETTKTFTIYVVGDTEYEGSETYNVGLINPTGNAAMGVGTGDTIFENDPMPGSGSGSTGGSDSSDNGDSTGDSSGDNAGSDSGDDGPSDPLPSGPRQADIIGGDSGPDTIQGTSGDDTIVAGDGESYLRGGEGNDVIAGGRDFDDINGNQGSDTASGGAGDDWVVGGKDNDSLTGDGGGDIVYGNLGDDSCDGGDDADIVRGGQGNDLVLGGAGDDWLSGDRGDDTVTGGAGADIFHTFGEAGIDRVTDFSLAEGDRVMLDPGTTYSLSQVGGDTVIAMGGGGQMILVGVSMASLTGDWIFGA